MRPCCQSLKCDGIEKLESRDFEIDPGMKVVELMDDAEIAFATCTQDKFELMINVLWNIRDHKKALNPQDPVEKHFGSGDTFAVYGEVLESDVIPTPKPESEKVPVTILTGFLGSGKTTLLNYILQVQSEKRIAIIENEFGEISIDDALLKQEKKSFAEKVVVMDNGCMCCTIRGDLAKGLSEIVSSIKDGSGIDCILIETTGMADPVPIVRTFMTDPELTKDLRLDAVIAMADAKHLPARLDDQVEEGKVNEAFQQVAFADKIILNKLDLITTEEAIAVKDRIRDINRFAKILPAVRGRVKISELTDIFAHDMSSFAKQNIEVEGKEAADFESEEGQLGHGGHAGHEEHGGHGGHQGGHDDAHGHNENCTEDHGHGAHGGEQHGTGHVGGHGGGGHGHGHGGGAAGQSRHDARVNSFSIVREGEILPGKLNTWMRILGTLPPRRGTVFRIKAILAVKGYPLKHVFHSVMDVSDEEDAGPWAAGEKKVSKIVFIGKSMDQAFLRKGFEETFE